MKEFLINQILIRFLGVNWKTSINGWLLLLCGGETAADAFNLVHTLPPDYQMKLQAFCMLFAAFGLLGAKDSNVSNSAVPVQPRKVDSDAPIMVARGPQEVK